VRGANASSRHIDNGVKSANITGDVQIVGVRRVELENVAGDATIKNISGDAGLENIGEAVDLTNLGGDLSVTNTPILRVRHSVGATGRPSFEYRLIASMRGCLKSPGRSRLTVRGPGFAPAVWKLEWGNIVGEI
jgi:hypothetical protein